MLPPSTTHTTTPRAGRAPRPEPHTLSGEFRAHRGFRSKFLTAERDVLVYLPPGYFEAEGAKHTEADWARRVDPILRFLFPRQ